MEQQLNIKSLYSGGIITNYYCSSRCRHCLYGSSPAWRKEYMSEEAADRIFGKILELGCCSVHVGGGEPLLDPEALLKVLYRARQSGMSIEYVETNSSWYHDESQCLKLLEKLQKAGVDTFLISISPFHNEFIPFYKVKGVAEACRKAGMSVFPWVEGFVPDLSALDHTKPHSLDEYCELFGKNYLHSTARRYHLNMRGRALISYRHLLPETSLEEFLEGTGPCQELSNTTHFHIDLYGNYIPGLCSGLSIYYGDLGKPLSYDNYPLISTLYKKGIKELLEHAERAGFVPAAKYVSKCHLCLEIRNCLAKTKGLKTFELQPLQYYDQVWPANV